MRISKIDTISMEPVRIKEHNPLNLVECGLDVVFAADDCEREVGKAISLD